MPSGALLVNEFLENEDIRRMKWPARSPDPNPIEHVWEAQGRQLQLATPSENHPGNQNGVAERVGPIDTGNDKLLYFKHEFTLQGLHIYQELEGDSKDIYEAFGRAQPTAEHRRVYGDALCFTARNYGGEFVREGGGNSKSNYFLAQ
ncbi:hypothetical protein AVEN_233208-1 [Araneus ventricosus]|uniref:Tc1-like transposase DDE domain-containing protein n=1 Tax=Araneus ventricosus TaxID=182803 RepID=A0A4Y2T302_ARAVE|nr:hypothetical protein AVEN_233208-1 [Araneus ventricosus]